MSPSRTNRFHLSTRAVGPVLASVALALVIGAAGFTASWADRELRAELLQQARMIAMSVSPEWMAGLSGTAVDLASPDYLRIKQQLGNIRLSNPDCRFLYLLSRRPDGKIIFRVDSEPSDSKDCSPAGQSYDEAPSELHVAFATGRAAVQGPYRDRWGAWVSAFVPLSARQTGGTQVVLGMDIAAAGWNWIVALRAALPVTLAVIGIMLGLLAALAHRSRRDLRVQKDALRESEQSYRNQFARNSTIMMLIDPDDGAILDANAAALNFYGYPRERLLTMRIADINTLPADQVLQAMATVSEGQGKRFEFQHCLADGAVRDVEVSASRIQFGERRVLHSIIHDITIRKQGEARIKVQAKLMDIIFEQSRDCIVLLDKDYNYIRVNDTYANSCRREVAEFTGHNHFEFYPSSLKDEFDDALRHEGIYSREAWPFRFPDQPERGVTFWDLTLMPVREPSGEIAFLFFTLKDVTERKRAEDKVRKLLKESDQTRLALLGIVEDQIRAETDLKRLATAVEQAAETVVITDLTGTIRYVNPAFERITGYTRAEALGQNPRILKSGKHDAAFYGELWKTISSGQSWTGRFVNKRKDGTFYNEEASISPVRDETGAIVSYVAVKRDITEHLHVEEQLRQAQKMESVGRLAGGVAHDFNNLLMGIMGYAELCREKIAPDHPIREWLNEITLDVERFAKLTHQLLAFARKQIIAPKVLDISDAIAGMLTLLRRLIGEDIAITWRSGPGVWPVRMDPIQIDQILANLVVNARDAISGVGSIGIEISNATLEPSYCAEHPGALPGSFVLLSVSDTGCGMDQKTLMHIFEPFFTTKGEGEGTGLGLATVYGIVKQNEGFIDVYSEPGKGTTFRIYLPRFVTPEAAPVAAEILTKPPRGNETILLVEDEKSVRTTTQIFLEDLGYTVLAAEDPKKALHLAAEQTGEIHLLITDVIMPGMSGRDLANRLLELRPTIKRLFISGFTADIIAQRGILDDGVNFLSKPFGRDQLARKVRELLEGKPGRKGDA